jgi:predicted DNA-binding transcriptional regulator AlpA
MPPKPEYTHILRPSLAYLEACGKLLLDSRDLAAFLQIPHKTVQQLVYSDRIPLPTKLGLGNCARWNIIELLDWVEAGCPRRAQWMAMRGRRG